MTLRIYLDSQDYYKLYKNRTDEQDYIFNFLLDKVSSKEIEIGFSYAVISEFLQDYNPQHKEDRILRARCIKSLCGKNAFKYMDRLNSEDSFSYKGEWTPDFGSTLSIKSLKNTFLDNVKKSFPNLGRSQMNMLKNKRGLKRLLKSNPSIYSTPLNYEEIGIPVSEKFIKENMLVKYIIGDLPKDTVETEFLKFVTDIELFIYAWFDYAGKKNFLHENIKQPGEKIKKTIELLRECILKERESKKEIKKFEKTVKESGLHNIFIHDISTLKEKIPDKIIIDKTWLKSLCPQISEEKIFPESFWDSMVCYLKHHSKTNQKIKDSDIVDIMHSIYIPYCDLWRGDKDFSHTLISENISEKEKIVSKLEDLPDRIKNKLNA